MPAGGDRAESDDDSTIDGADSATDDGSVLRRARRVLGRAVRWLREFNRGYSGTGHLPNRKR